uniref:ARAD1D14278p n=1 Tax=Blastobotrys adeninivorans TaxID=409370 RepID=A0A060TEC5_BLAAD
MPKVQRPSTVSRAKLMAAKRRRSSAGVNVAKQEPKLTEEQLQETRTKIRKNLETKLSIGETLPTDRELVSASAVAQEIEAAVFQDHNEHIDDEYKATIRRIMICLGDAKTGYRHRLLTKDIDGAEFARLSVNEMKSSERRNSDENLKKEGIRRATIAEVLPEDINKIKDGRDREKWGVTHSAASIDD